MKKLIAFLMVMVLVVSLIPVSAMAVRIPDFSDVPVQDGPPPRDTKEEEQEEELEDLMDTSNLKAPEKKEDDDDDDDDDVYKPHTPEDKIIGYGCNTKYHWKQCSCGCRIAVERHVDPKDTTDDTCICGYHFSDNADLVTLWVKGCPPIKDFDKNQTEYKLNAYTYKDVKQIKISTRTFDSEGTVELPKDLTLKEGENKFDVKVTSENQKVTKTYTLIITK